MPFMVTKARALSIARYVARLQHLLGGYTRTDAYMTYVDTYSITPWFDGYAWVVQFLKTLMGGRDAGRRIRRINRRRDRRQHRLARAQ